MKQIATFDRAAFGRRIEAELAIAGLSYGAFVAAHPWANKALVSRAIRADKPLSATHVLAFCAAFGLDPMRYFSFENQAVTNPVSRETQIGGILDSMRGRA